MSNCVLSHIFFLSIPYTHFTSAISHTHPISCPFAIRKTFIIIDTTKCFTLPGHCVHCTFFTCCFIGIQFYFIIIYSRSLIESFVSLINQWPSPIALCIVKVSIVPMAVIIWQWHQHPAPPVSAYRWFIRETTDSKTHQHIHKYLLIFGIDPKTHFVSTPPAFYNWLRLNSAFDSVNRFWFALSAQLLVLLFQCLSPSILVTKTNGYNAPLHYASTQLEVVCWLLFLKPKRHKSSGANK